jgi:DNA-binding transcriptional MerR regulator
MKNLFSDNKKLIKIGQFADFVNSSPSTLRYYEKKISFKPYKVNKNGYRLYKIDQCEQYRMILVLKESGFSLKQIGEIIKRNRSMKRLIKKKTGFLKEEINRLTFALDSMMKIYRRYSKNRTNYFYTPSL